MATTKIESPKTGDEIEIHVQGEWERAIVAEVYVSPPGFIAVWLGGSEHIFTKDHDVRWRRRVIGRGST